jgi:hypothetical protein
MRGSAPVGMIRNICGTIFAVSKGNSGVSRGQRTNSPDRDSGLRSRERRFESCRGARGRPERASEFGFGSISGDAQLTGGAQSR